MQFPEEGLESFPPHPHTPNPSHSGTCVEAGVLLELVRVRVVEDGDHGSKQKGEGRGHDPGGQAGAEPDDAVAPLRVVHTGKAPVGWSRWWHRVKRRSDNKRSTSLCESHGLNLSQARPAGNYRSHRKLKRSLSLTAYLTDVPALAPPPPPPPSSHFPPTLFTPTLTPLT